MNPSFSLEAAGGWKIAMLTKVSTYLLKKQYTRFNQVNPQLPQMVTLFCYYILSFTGQELIPNGAYSGQKLMRLVNTNTTDSTNSTMPKVPVIVPLK